MVKKMLEVKLENCECDDNKRSNKTFPSNELELDYLNKKMDCLNENLIKIGKILEFMANK